EPGLGSRTAAVRAAAKVAAAAARSSAAARARSRAPTLARGSNAGTRNGGRRRMTVPHQHRARLEHESADVEGDCGVACKPRRGARAQGKRRECLLSADREP